MSLQLILGVSKTGKSSYIYDNIKNDILENKNVILFVPSFMKVKEEEEYMDFLGTCGLIGVNITTIQDFIENNLKRYRFNLEQKYLSEMDKKLILSSIVKNNKEVFNIFSKVINKPGFISSLSIYMDLIRKSDININDNIPNFKNKILEQKILELVNIYQKYEEFLSKNYVDYQDEMNIFIDNVLNFVINSNNTKIYFDGYNNFNKSEYKFIENCLKNNIDTTITLCTDISELSDVYDESSLDIFNSVNKTYIRLLNLANKNNTTVQNVILDKDYFKGNRDIKFLADNLFKTNSLKFKENTENICLRLLTNPYEEANFVAKIINEKIKERV